MKGLLIVVACALSLGQWTANVFAQSPAEQVEKGLSEFQDLEFAKAVTTLEAVLSSSQATPSQQILALELIAISHLSLGRASKAQAAFRRLLELSPDYELQNHDGSPKVIDVFESVRKELAAEAASGGDTNARKSLLLSWTPPTKAVAGKKVSLIVVANGPAPSSMILWWKSGEDARFAQAPMRRVEGIQWRARLRLPKSPNDYEVSFYVEALGPAGETQGTLATRDEPASLVVGGRASGGKSSGTPWYGNWKVWAGVGAATFLGGTIAILGSGSDPREGSLSPGRITLSP